MKTIPWIPRIHAVDEAALQGRFGQGDHCFLGGPWPKGTPQQGYKSRLTPAQPYRAAIAAIDGHVGVNANGASFANPVSALRKQRVLDAIQAVGYQTNAIARSLKTGSTKTIGLMIADITSTMRSDIRRRLC